MEVPWVQVILTAASKHNEIDRTLRLDAINRVVKIGRASSRSSCADSALDNNCFLKSPIVSRNHGRFVIGDRAHPLKLIDDGSTHGTFVNNVRLLPSKEFTLENDSRVTFGNDIIHGNCNYSPTVFRVSFIWHDPIIPDTFPFWSVRPGIRAPTPESDSEVEENGGDVETQTPYARSPSVVVLDGPPCIDLTGDVVSSHEHRSVDQDVLSTTANHGDEPVRSQWNSNKQEEDSVVKETNLPPKTSKGSYRFDYADSDELESVSHGSPPPRDFDSLYDNSDESDVPSSPHSHHTEELELETGDTGSEGEVGMESDEEEAPSEPSLEAHDMDDDTESDIDGTGEDILEDDEDDLATDVDKQVLTSYQQSLKWLGAGEDAKAESIVQLFEAKVNADPDVRSIALECVRVIADETPDEELGLKLEHWLYYGDLPESQAEMETECSGPSNLSTVPELLTMNVPSTPMMPPISRANYTNMREFEPSFFTTYPPERLLAQSASSFSGHTINLNHGHFPFASVPTWHSCTSQPSPVMQISNLVDKVSAELQPAISNILPPRPEENVSVVEPDEDQSSQDSDTSPKIGTAEELNRLIGAETSWFIEEKEPVSLREGSSSSLESVSSGKKRKLGDTDLEEQEDTLSETPATSSVSTNFLPLQDQPHESQPSDPKPAHRVESDGSQTPVRKMDAVPVLGDVVPTSNQERGQPPKQKRRISVESQHRPGFLKTVATHCIAGAVGAVGLIAAIVATTPAQLKEELLYHKI